MAVEKFDNNKKYLRVVGGKLVESSDEKNPESVRREFTDKKGVTKVYYDLVYKNVSGKLQKLKLRDTNFGEMLDIVFEDEIVTLGLNSRFFQNFMQKIPNAILDEKIMLYPFDFKGKNGKQIKGLGLSQASGKLKNFYYDEETKQTINGFPEPEGEPKAYSKDDWKLYFLQVTKFLKNKVEEINEQLEEIHKSDNLSDTTDTAEMLNIPEEEDELRLDEVPL
jgi:hypothetical protein